jgi:hypothetical protein
MHLKVKKILRTQNKSYIFQFLDVNELNFMFKKQCFRTFKKKCDSHSNPFHNNYAYNFIVMLIR